MTMKLLIDRISSPMGTMLLISDGSSLCALDFADCEVRMLKLLQKRYPSFESIETSRHRHTLRSCYWSQG
jgi:methylated-DNA-[protein]-cysteine S-methyltransferase